jgi:DNA-binding NarL/FixJ family response regulator
MNERDNRLRVFVVEDSKVLVKRIVEWFESDPSLQVVGTADAAAEAIEKIEKLHPDAVIVDVALTSGTGFDVLRAMRRSADGAWPTVIMFTNHSTPPYRTAAEQLGVTYFFDKTRDFVRLVDLVRSLAEGRGGGPQSEG